MAASIDGVLNATCEFCYHVKQDMVDDLVGKVVAMPMVVVVVLLHKGIANEFHFYIYKMQFSF